MSLKPAWDSLASGFVASQLQQARALAFDESRIQLLLRCWGIAIVLTLIVIGIVLKMLPVAIGLCVLLILLPRWFLGWVIRRRRNLLRDQMVGCARTLANSARAGQSLTQALESVAAESPFPLNVELQRVVGEYHLGRPLIEALADARNRLKLDSFSLFVSSIIISLQRGGRVTEALERICRSLQENQRIERKLAAETASGWRVVLILTAFPFLFLIGFAVLHPEGTALMFYSLVGQFLLLVIMGLVVGSIWWSRKILTIDI
jgi:tight adherence protein B